MNVMPLKYAPASIFLVLCVRYRRLTVPVPPALSLRKKTTLAPLQIATFVKRGAFQIARHPLEDVLLITVSVETFHLEMSN
jgi:hypothetical protein